MKNKHQFFATIQLKKKKQFIARKLWYEISKNDTLIATFVIVERNFIILNTFFRLTPLLTLSAGRTPSNLRSVRHELLFAVFGKFQYTGFLLKKYSSR